MHKRLISQICLMAVLCLTAQGAEPLAHWPFDGHLDDVAGAANGEFFGGSPGYVQGRMDQAIRFDGVDDYVEVMVDNLDTYTITAWVMPERTDAASILVRTSPSGPITHWSHQIRIAASGVFEHYLYDGSERHVFGTTQIEAGDWYFVAVDATNNGPMRLYVNAQQEGGEVTIGTLWGDGDRFLVGSNSGHGMGWLQGIIDDVRIYDQELNEAEMTSVMTAEPFPFAFGPKPQDKAMIEQTAVVLDWRPGDFATSHHVYFGESPDHVSQATPEDEAFRGNQTETLFPVQDLTPGTTYYWRVDEVNDAIPGSPWQGALWSFRVRPLIAWGPSPADGVHFVVPGRTLSWEKGLGTLFHVVYFGESFDEVNDATTGGWMVADAVYDPGPMELQKTYYWRVDEFDGRATHEGDVWSFATIPPIEIADPNLLGWWTLHEGEGTTVVDWSGHGHHGTLRGNPQWVDGALAFDGQNDYVSVPLDVSETAYAAALRFKTTNGNCGLMAVVDSDLGANNDRHIYLTNGNLKIRLWDTEEIETAGRNLADGRWHHVVYTYGAPVGGQKLYVDGVLGASGSKDASDFDWQQRINIGYSHDASRRFFEGVLENVRVYDKALSEEEVQQLMRGDPLLAWDPAPQHEATVDIRDATALGWSAGDTAASHDVYFGTDRSAVTTADRDAAEYQGGQPGTSFALAGLVRIGGGDYYWRIDEVEANGTVHVGNVWKFTVPPYLIVDDFESYTNEPGERVFQIWIDGWGFSPDAVFPDGHPGNGTGALIGYDPLMGNIMETTIVNSPGRSMPLQYDNTAAPGYSETERTFAPAQNWTVEGVTTVVVHFRGDAANTGQLYVKINGTKVPYNGDSADIASTEWIAWEIDLASVGVNLTSITTLTIGIEGGDTGIVYVDDIRLTRP